MADTVFTITIPEAQTQRVVDALADHFSYTEADGPKAAFVRDRVVGLLKRLVVRQEAQDAEEAARGNPRPDITGAK